MTIHEPSPSTDIFPCSVGKSIRNKNYCRQFVISYTNTLLEESSPTQCPVSDLGFVLREGGGKYNLKGVSGSQIYKFIKFTNFRPGGAKLSPEVGGGESRSPTPTAVVCTSRYKVGGGGGSATAPTHLVSWCTPTSRFITVIISDVEIASVFSLDYNVDNGTVIVNKISD